MNLMEQGLLLTVVGMGTVFVSLFTLAVLMRLLGLIAACREENERDRAEVPKGEIRGAPAGDVGERDLLPVVAAAVGVYLETRSAQVFLIPVERPDRSRWVLDGRVDALSRADALGTEKRL